MKHSLRNKTAFEKFKAVLLSLIILGLFFFGIFAEKIFPGTQFSEVIADTVGKFFNLVDFFKFSYMTIIETFSVIIFIWLVYKALSIIMSFIVKIRKKSATVINLVMSALKYVSLIVAFFMILSTWGVETPTLLASAGIIAIAVSFGAQSLIEDIFSGIFIIFENQFAIGDIIQIGDFRGIVKTIGIRVTKFEDINGDIKIINNSDIRGAINSSNLLSQAICYIDISYNQDINKFETMIRKNLGSISEAIPMIKKGPFYDGIERFQESGVTIRIVSWVNEVDRLIVRRQMNKQLKILFEKNNIEIPFPQVVVHNAPIKRKTVSKATKTKTTTKPKTVSKAKTKTPVKKASVAKKPTATKKTTATTKTKK